MRRTLIGLFLVLFLSACAGNNGIQSCPAQAPRAGLQVVYVGPSGAPNFNPPGVAYFGQIQGLTATGASVRWEHLGGVLDTPLSSLGVEGACSVSVTGRTARYIGPPTLEFPTAIEGTVRAGFESGKKVFWPSLGYATLATDGELRIQ